MIIIVIVIVNNTIKIRGLKVCLRNWKFFINIHSHTSK